MSQCEKILRDIEREVIGRLMVGGEPIESIQAFDRIKKFYAAKPRTPVKKFSGKGSRVGKLGIVRLKGRELRDLRMACFGRDGFKCVQCGCVSSLEMAHIRTKRNNGDTLSNVRTLCGDCHAKSHNAGGRPCPRKDGSYA